MGPRCASSSLRNSCRTRYDRSSYCRTSRTSPRYEIRESLPSADEVAFRRNAFPALESTLRVQNQVFPSTDYLRRKFEEARYLVEDVTIAGLRGWRIEEADSSRGTAGLRQNRTRQGA